MSRSWIVAVVDVGLVALVAACAHAPPRRRFRLDRRPGRPVSRILLYPAIHLRGFRPGLLAELRLPVWRPDVFGLLAPVVYLAGPSRDTAGGLLPHPFTHHL